MNKPVKPSTYWGTKTDFQGLLAQIEKIGPILEQNAEENDRLGKLNDATVAALKPLRMSHIFAAEKNGGAQLPPTQGLRLIEAITYSPVGGAIYQAAVAGFPGAEVPPLQFPPPPGPPPGG